MRVLDSPRNVGIAIVAMLAVVFGTVGITQTAQSAVPAPPTSCSADRTASGGVLVSWVHPDANLTRFHVREQGVSNPLEVDGDARSVVWPRALVTADPNFTIRAFNADGYSTSACDTGPIKPFDGDPEPTPTPTPTPTPSPSPTPTPTDPPPPVGNAELPCTPDSFFKSRVDGAGVPISATLTQQFRSFMASHPEQASIPFPKVNVNNDWSGIHHVSKASDPIWRLTGGNTTDSELSILRTQGVHLADAVLNVNPSGSQDRLLVIYDPVFGYVAQMADTTPNFATRTITVSNAGIMWYNSNCLDNGNPRSDDPRNETSRGRIVPSMQIPAAFMQKAIDNNTGIGYTLHLFFVETDTAAGHVHPMTGSEGSKNGFGAEGLRVRLNPNINLDARGLTPGCEAIAKTLQQHGGYLGDNSGSSTQIKVGHPSQYPASFGLSANCLQGKVLWSEFEVVAPGFQ